MTEVHGPQSKCYKNSMYQVLEYGPHRVMNIDVISDRKEHRTRRQAWDKAFSAKGLQNNAFEVFQTDMNQLSRRGKNHFDKSHWNGSPRLTSFKDSP